MSRGLIIGVTVALAALVTATGCDEDEPLTLDAAADVDAGAVAGEDGAAVDVGLFGAADVTFDGVTAAVSDVRCIEDGRLTVTPIVTDTFTLTIDGDPASGVWNVQVTQPGEPQIVWTTTAPTVELDGDALAGSAELQRTDDPSATANLAFVIDC